MTGSSFSRYSTQLPFVWVEASTPTISILACMRSLDSRHAIGILKFNCPKKPYPGSEQAAGKASHTPLRRRNQPLWNGPSIPATLLRAPLLCSLPPAAFCRASRLRYRVAVGWSSPWETSPSILSTDSPPKPTLSHACLVMLSMTLVSATSEASSSQCPQRRWRLILPSKHEAVLTV